MKSSLHDCCLSEPLPDVPEAEEEERDDDTASSDAGSAAGTPHGTTGSSESPTPWTLEQAEVERLFWRHNTEAVLFPQDQAAWGAGFLFLCFIINTMGADPAYVVCGAQMLAQLVWMARFPASYKANRDNICLGIRIWRIYVNSRLCTRFAFQSQAAKPLVRSLLIASGALVNCVVSVGYQLKLATHLKLQLLALAVSVASGTATVTAFMNQPQHRAATGRVYDAVSDAASFLLEGVNFPGHRKLGYAPDQGLVVVLMAQLYIGFLAPTYILYLLEHAARLRFRAHLHALAGCAPAPPASPPPAATAVDAFYMALFALLTHALILALSAAALWELLCCSTTLLAAARLPALSHLPLPPALLRLLPAAASFALA